jgi:hypothetical protein
LDFASYWKEIAVVLAALFAITSTIFEVKDKASHRITIWGRIFFGLTILSMIGGFYAQWEQNARDALRSKQSQDDMLKVIENTNRNVHDMSRILQPLGRSNVYLAFTPNCIEVKEFCDAAVKEGERESPTDKSFRISSFSIGSVDWSKWPNRTNIPTISLLFFKDQGQAKKFVESDCLGCKSDMSFELFFDTSEIVPSKMPSVMYVIDIGQLYIGVGNNDITPNVNNDKLLSTIDLPGSTLIIRDSGDKTNLFKKLKLISITIHTDRGQTIDIENPTMVNAKDETLFEYVFPDSPH